MRVYRSCSCADICCRCPLIIREGISQFGFFFSGLFLSPHYTWGYIAWLYFWLSPPAVPSLYVRVYRIPDTGRATTISPLIIREGISDCKKYKAAAQMSPHYTWGYIAEYKTRREEAAVPSLYVRVYRLIWNLPRIWHCPLIIREGISNNADMITACRWSPHYTWGYIAPADSERLCSCVPSLYVRVYRVHPGFQSLTVSSLIIREGISPKSGA